MSNIFEGKAVVLRTPTEVDLPYIRSLWADPDTMREVGGPIFRSPEQMAAWFRQMVDPGSDKDRYFLTAVGGQLVGEASWHRYDAATKTAELNIKIEAKHRGRGHFKQALRLLLERYFVDFGGEVMRDPVALDNTAGQQALRKFGFEHDTSRTDVFMVRMTLDQYLKIRSG